MARRTITGTVVNGQGDPISGAPVSFTMDRGTYLLDPDLHYAASNVSARTDGDGAFSVELEAGLPVLWNVSLPSQTFVVAVPEGGAITLEELRAQFSGTVPERVPGDPPTVTNFTNMQHPHTNAATGGVLPLVQPVFNVAAYGAVLDGTTDDHAAIQGVIDGASVAGGDVVIPAGESAAISTTLTLKNNVRLLLSPGASLKWTGASGGTMINSGGTDPLLRSGIIGGTLDPNELADYVIDVRSPQFCEFGCFDTEPGHATTVVLRMRTDVTNFSGYDGTKNAVHNWVHDVVADTCGTVLSLTGTDATAICTLNEYRNIHGGDVRVFGIRIVRWVDNNKFTGIHRYEINADNAVGLIMQDTGSPTVDAGVYSNNFDYLAIDAFGSRSGRKGVVLNSSKYTVIRDFTAAPEPEGGALDLTNSTSHMIMRGGTDLDASIVVSTRDVEHPDGFAVDSTHKLYNDANGPIWLVDGNGYMSFNRANDLFEFVAAGGFAMKVDALGLTNLTRMALTDGVTAPDTLAGHAQLYVDTADGDLKVKFSDGTIKTIMTDT